MLSKDGIEDGKDVTLEEYGIPQVYDVVGGMLGVIKDGGLDGAKKMKAVEGTVGVVKEMKKGRGDVGQIVQAAFRDDGDCKGKEKGKEGDGKDFGKLDLRGLDGLEGGSGGLLMTPRGGCGEGVTPSVLLKNLGKVQPELFPPGSARKVLTPPRFEDGLGKKGEFKENGWNGNECLANGNGKTWFDGVVKSFEANSCGNNDVVMSMNEKVDQDNKPDDQKSAGATNNNNLVRRTSTRCKKFDTTGKDVASTNHHQQQQQPIQQMPQNNTSATMSDSSGHSSRDDGDSKNSTPTKRKSNISTTSSTDSKHLSPKNGLVKVPKKRGRKRKFPELSDEERKALRQAQNRESAKQSRIRRKSMAAEYEKKMSTLNDENNALKDEVSVLNNRLSFLQSLLTVSVNPKKLKIDPSMDSNNGGSASKK